MVPIVDIETSKNLRKAGYPQLESSYYWVAKDTQWGKDYIRMPKADVMFDVYEFFAAPDALELGWNLLDKFVYHRYEDPILACFGRLEAKKHHTLQEMADTWIYMQENEVKEALCN